MVRPLGGRVWRPWCGRRDQRGFTLIELLMVVAIIGLLSAIMVAMLQNSIRKAHIAAVAGECKSLYSAFGQFYIDNKMYPYASTPPAFNLRTFDPLRSKGYYTGGVARWLKDGKADAFDSPDGFGTNQEYWLEMTLAIDPSVRFLVANSNEAPLGGGQWYDGIYMFKNGVLTKL